MDWVIERISPKDESVFLVKETTGVRRVISVPGLESAVLRENTLLIHSNKGFYWLIDPATGSRRRFPIEKAETRL